MKARFNSKPRSLKIALISALVFGSLGAGMNSQAAQETGTFAVGGTVTASCTISGADIAFGSTIDSLGADVDTSSSLTATCTNGSPYTIGLDAGTSLGATVTTRKLTHTDGTSLLNYSLSGIASGGTNWDNIGGTTVVGGTGSGGAQTITVFARIPTGQTGTIAGVYADTVTATIDF